MFSNSANLNLPLRVASIHVRAPNRSNSLADLAVTRDYGCFPVPLCEPPVTLWPPLGYFSL